MALQKSLSAIWADKLLSNAQLGYIIDAAEKGSFAVDEARVL